MIFEITVQEANLIIASLNKLPYEAVADLIPKLMKQGREQAEQAEQTQTPIDKSE